MFFMQVNKIGEYILKMYNKNVIDFKKINK